MTAVIYAGTAQPLNGLASDQLALGTLYQICHSRCSCLVSSLRVVAGLQRLFPFQQIVNLLLNNFCKHIDICIKCYSYSRIGTNENKSVDCVVDYNQKGWKPLSGCRQLWG